MKCCDVRKDISKCGQSPLTNAEFGIWLKAQKYSDEKYAAKRPQDRKYPVGPYKPGACTRCRSEIRGTVHTTQGWPVQFDSDKAYMTEEGISLYAMQEEDEPQPVPTSSTPANQRGTDQMSVMSVDDYTQRYMAELQARNDAKERAIAASRAAQANPEVQYELMRAKRLGITDIPNLEIPVIQDTSSPQTKEDPDGDDTPW